MTESAKIPSDIQAAVDAGYDAAAAHERVYLHGGAGGIPVAITRDNQRVTVLQAAIDAADARAETPRRRVGTAIHQELASFVAHVNRFKDPGSAVFSDVAKVTVTAVLDYHTAAGPRWGQHRALYTCPLSQPWQAWTGKDGATMGQDAFGLWIEDHMDDLAAGEGFPAPCAVLDMARNLAIHSKATFERRTNPTTGESSLVAKEEHEESSTKIPRAFLLRLPVFEGGTVYAVEARVRLQVAGGKAQFTVALYRTDAILRDAFGEVRKAVADGCALPVFCGTPE